MPHQGNGQSTRESVRDSVRGVPRAADERGCESIAVHAVGCGPGGAPLLTGAAVIPDVLADVAPAPLASAQFVVYTDDQREAVALLL
jgi:O-acetyl-ADP-ribose deacetylase (regulator of RNase III)